VGSNPAAPTIFLAFSIKYCGGSLMQCPTLITQRLILRPHRRSDFQDMVSLWSDPDVVRHIGGRAFSADETWARLLRYAGSWPMLGFGFWLFEDKATGRFVGEGGLLDAMRPIEPALPEGPEVGWALVADFHRQGLAAEAIAAVLAWADAAGWPRTSCIIDAQNVASVRVAERLGYVRLHTAGLRGVLIDVFSRCSAS